MRRHSIMCSIFLLLGISCFICVYQKKHHPRAIRRIKPIYKTGKEMEQKYGIVMKSYSEQYCNPARAIILEMQVPNHISKEMSQLIIVDTARELMKRINSRPELVDFFSIFPIRPENMFIRIESVFGSEGEGISATELVHGQILYTEQRTNKSSHVLNESFKDAVLNVIATDHEFHWNQEHIYPVLKT